MGAAANFLKNKYQNQFVSLVELLEEKNQEESEKKFTCFLQDRKQLANQYQHMIIGNIGNEEARLVRPVITALGEIAYKIQELENGMNDKFLLFIVGMGKVGKSTLINSLLEQDVAIMDTLPKTWKIDVYEYMEKRECQIAYKTGKVERLSVEQTIQLINEEEEKAYSSHKHFKAELKKKVTKNSTKEEIAELTKTLQQKYLYKSEIINVQWPIKENQLSEKFKLVDTPGLVQENLSGELKYSLNEYYHNADGVIWIIDANKLSGRKQHELISELKEAIEHIGGSTDNIVCVINRIDSIRKNGEDAVKEVVAEAERLFGQYFKKFIPISAKEAYEGFKQGNPLSRNSSGIVDLYREIDNRFYKKARSIKLDSKEISLKQLLLLEEDHPINSYYDRLLKDQVEYQSNIEMVKQAMKEKLDLFLSEMEASKNTFIQQVSDRVESLTSNLFDLDYEAKKRDYMLNSIFRVQEVEAQINHLLWFWGDSINKLTKELHPEILFKEYEYVDEALVHSIVNGSRELQLPMSSPSYDFTTLRQENQLPTLTDTSGMESFFEGALGQTIGGILSGIGKGIVKLFTMGGVKANLRSHFASYMENNVRTAHEHLQKQIDLSIKYLETEMHDSFKVLHGTYYNSLNTRRFISEWKKEIKETHQRPDLYDILKIEKEQLNEHENPVVIAKVPESERRRVSSMKHRPKGKFRPKVGV
jgi:predicted GTPase